MQAYEISTKCSRCDILLAGREQFVGHMIHGHDTALEQAEAIWKSMCTATHVDPKVSKMQQKCFTIQDLLLL